MRKTIAAAMALMLWSVGAGAERLADILQTIRANNTGLKAMLKDIEADNADTRADNTVGGPSVEYSPFWQKNVDGVASSELVVSQEFDFPTLYSARGKSADLKDKALMLQYDAARRFSRPRDCVLIWLSSAKSVSCSIYAVDMPTPCSV